MFVVLSEINCLKTLNNYGVYPDEFYTDFELFRENSINYQGAQVMIICAGSCRFNKRQILELIKILTKRIKTNTDNSLESLYVVSDVILPGLKSYYKYEKNMDKVDMMQGWSCVKKDIDIWSKLRCQERHTELYLSDFDKGVAYHREREHTQDDDYIKLIKIPSLDFSE